MLDIDRRLQRIVSNLWFEWNADVHGLLQSIVPDARAPYQGNWYRLFKLKNQGPSPFRERIASLVSNSEFVRLVKRAEESFHSYMKPQETYLLKHYPELGGRTVAYFSMEYGIDMLRIYSGGLGILSGDYLRGSSDLGLNVVGVGLFYLEGYYEQQVSSEGTMKVKYESLVPPVQTVQDYLPLESLKRSGTDADLVMDVPLGGRSVKVRVWRARIGRNDLILLDSNLPENRAQDRHLTRRLYASQKHRDEERKQRLEQELVLGIGGVKALDEAGYSPSVYHFN